MNTLNPTLWRTCRVLCGQNRIALLRALVSTPGQNITELAHAVGIGLSDASQELRRLQSRGLLSADRKGRFVIYNPTPDPQVPTAAPLLNALEMAMKGPKERDDEILLIAQGLAHPKRVEIARTLKKQARSTLELEQTLGYHRNVVNRHLRILVNSGFVHRKGKLLLYIPSSHPLSLVLSDCL